MGPYWAALTWTTCQPCLGVELFRSPYVNAPPAYAGRPDPRIGILRQTTAGVPTTRLPGSAATASKAPARRTQSALQLWFWHRRGVFRETSDSAARVVLKEVPMQRVPAILAVFVLAALCAAQTIYFDSDAVGSVPASWTVAMTHTGGAPKWEVLRDDTAPSKPNVLAQTSTDRTGGRFPLAIYETADLTNGAVMVKFKPVSGSGDQAAGIVWRYKDPDNYYIVRANALEDNVVLYKVEAGKRISLAPKGTPAKTYGVKHPVLKQIWATLRIEFQGNLFTVLYDGKKLFEVEDGTFPGSGKVGLWTKADSVTYFDDFRIESK